MSTAPAASLAVTGIEPWIDLIAAALCHARMGGAAVVLHEAQRVFPLLEQRLPTGWIHARQPVCADFTPGLHQRPARRERLDASAHPDEAARLLARAVVRVLCVPTDPRAAATLLPLVADAPASDEALWMVYAAAGLPTWDQALPVCQRLGLVELNGRGMRLCLSPALHGALQVLGLGSAGFTPLLARDLAAALPPSLDAHFDLDEAGAPRLRIRPDPLRFIASASDALPEHIAVQERALLNARGIGSLLLPWDGCGHARLLLRNVRARVDGSEIAIGQHSLPLSDLNYTEQGAILSLSLPPVGPGRDALLHLAVPRDAVPPDDFCDVGAVEYTAELA